MSSETKRCVTMVQVRLPRELVRQIDHWSIDRDLWRAQAVEVLLRAGLEAIAPRSSDEEAQP